MSNLKKQLVKGTIWSFAGQIIYLLVGLAANIILARMLSPYEFGQMGIIMFFITISKVLTESGLSGALIRKQDASNLDFSTVFVFNLLVSLFLFLVLCLSSGIIADFYKNKDLKLMLISLSSIIIINAFQFTQSAKIIRDMRFKAQSLYALIAVCLSSAIGIGLAYFNFGVWALVIMQVSNALFLSLLYFLFEDRKIGFTFNKQSFQSLYKFGVNTTLASIITSVFDNIYNLILGKFFNIQQTGLYFQAKKLQEIPIGVIQSSTLGVVFSTLSKVQDDKQEFDILYGKITKIFTVLVGVICGLIFFYSEFCISILYGAKWLGSVFYLKILIIGGFFFMQEMLNRVLFKVFDKTEKILKLELIKKAVLSFTIIVGIYTLSIEYLMYGFLVTSIVSYFINYYVSRTVYNNFSWLEIRTVLFTALGSIIVVIIFEELNSFLKLSIVASLFYLPFMVFAYFILIRGLGVLDVVKEYKNLLSLIRK